MSIKCGSCKGRHESVAEVRDCSQERSWDGEIQRREREEDRRVAHAKAMRDAHVFQGGFSGTGTCPGCGATRGHTHTDECRTYAAQASRRTPANLDEQRTRQARRVDYGHEPHTAGYDLERSWGREKFPEVGAGWYALRDQDEESTIRFYQVDRPDEGRWAGYTFLSVMASDERYPIKKVDTKREILSRIAENPRAAMELFGQQIGQCGKCHRTLTDKVSREIGIGPVCREQL